MSSQLGDSHEVVGGRVAIYECVAKIQDSLRAVDDVHGTEGGIALTNAYYFFSNLDGVRVFGVETCDESVGIAYR